MTEAPELPYHVRLAIQQQAERERKANTPLGRFVTLVFAGVLLAPVLAFTGVAVDILFFDTGILAGVGQYWAAQASLVAVSMFASVGAFITAALLVKR